MVKQFCNVCASGLEHGESIDYLISRRSISHGNPPSSCIIRIEARSIGSQAYQALLQQQGFICFMSSEGIDDNAVMESFYHTLKVEILYGVKYATRKDAQLAIFDYIEVFYNRQRLHSTLGYLTPHAFELSTLNWCPVFWGRIIFSKN